MTKEEAIKIIKANWDKYQILQKPLKELIPELRESENERIRRILVESFEKASCSKVDKFVDCKLTSAEILAWFEKQEEISESKAYGILSKKGYVILEREAYNELCDKAEQKELKPISFNQLYNPDEYDVIAEGNATSLKRKEQKSIEDVIKNITKNKEAAIEFLKSTGIMDENGELAEMYRSEQSPADHLSVRDDFDLEGNLKQKPAEWNDKERSYIITAIALLKQYKGFCIDNALTKSSCDFAIEGLESLQPIQQEWSEEDEKIMQTMIKEGDLKPSEIIWLKRIRERLKKL